MPNFSNMSNFPCLIVRVRICKVFSTFFNKIAVCLLVVSKRFGKIVYVMLIELLCEVFLVAS